MSSKKSYYSYRRRPLSIRIAFAGILVVLGVILIVYWLPVWIWVTLFGIILVICGIRIYLFSPK